MLGPSLMLRSPLAWILYRHASSMARSPQGQCPPPTFNPERIIPHPECPPKPVAPNPCVPVFHTGKDSYKKYKNIFFFLLLPLIALLSYLMTTLKPHPKEVCREYEYMRKRTKRFPWGDGDRSFFHNEHTNSLPCECEPPEEDICEKDD